MTTRMASTTGSTTEIRETGNEGMKHLQKRGFILMYCVQYLNDKNYCDRPTLYVYRHIEPHTCTCSTIVFMCVRTYRSPLVRE